MIIPKRKIRYPIAIEREYAKLLVAYVKAEFKIVESFIPEMTDALIRNAIKQDDTDDYEESLTEKMLKVAGLLVVFDKMRKKLQKISPTKIIDKIFGRVNKHVEREHSETIKSVFGSEPRVEKNNRQFEMLKTVWTAENMTLIKSIDSQTMDKIRFTLSQKIIATANREMLMSDLTKEIQQLAGVSETRAALIGADQVGKLNGRLTQYRQMSAGIESYIWRTMGDRRVRPNHAARSGLVFKWSNPPDGGHPGQAVRCRCVAQPLIDEQSFKLVPQKNSYTNYAESDKISTNNFGGAKGAMKTDCARIAANTGFREQDIRRIKNHVFYEKHLLDDGLSRFDPDYEMAQSWQRLIEGKNIESRDIILLNHEFLESIYMSEGLRYSQAHDKAEKIYNYVAALKEVGR